MEPQTLDQSLQLEVGKLAAITAGYPDGIREDVQWIGGYLRERCNRNVAALEAQVKKLGYDTHATTFSRILRGKLVNPDGKPVMKLKTFSALVEALRREDQIAALAGKVPFVETTTWQDFKNYVDFKRAPETVCKFGLVIGPTGSQKTACAKQYAMRNNHGTTIHIESPETPMMMKFITKIARAYGVSEFHNGEKKRARITASVNDRSTIIVDNIQRMFRPRQGWSQPIFNYLQQLQDDTGCTVIMMCVPEFEMTLAQGMDNGYFEQFEGRVGGRSEFLLFDEYAPREDVEAIADAFGLEEASKHIQELENIARRRGRIRILFNALQKAKRRAESARKPLTMKFVRAVLAPDDADEN